MGYTYRGKQAFTPGKPERDESKLKPCGTKAAYDRHKYRGEPVDDACRDAYRAYETARRARPKQEPQPKRSAVGPKPRQPEQPCGTHAAAQRHYRNQEPLCDPCREAKAEYEKAGRATRANRQRRTVQCGTYSGAKTHRINKEPLCEPCRRAANEYQNAHRKAKRMTSGVPYGTIYPNQQKAAA